MIIIMIIIMNIMLQDIILNMYICIVLHSKVMQLHSKNVDR